jgi:hypothetical protein
VQQQDSEQRTLLAPAERERAILFGHLQWPKKPKIHSGVCCDRTIRRSA